MPILVLRLKFPSFIDPKKLAEVESHIFIHELME